MLHLRPFTLSSEYLKKWNESSTDFVHLYKDEIRVNHSLYRLGGLTRIEDLKNDYFMLIKYTEDLYEDKITTDKDKKHHLKGEWVIIDKKGVEKKVFDQFKHPSIIGGLVYSYESKFYNIETGFFYGYTSSSALTSKDFIFIDTKYTSLWDKSYNKDMIGIVKINMHDGTYEVFK